MTGTQSLQKSPREASAVLECGAPHCLQPLRSSSRPFDLSVSLAPLVRTPNLSTLSLSTTFQEVLLLLINYEHQQFSTLCFRSMGGKKKKRLTVIRGFINLLSKSTTESTRQITRKVASTQAYFCLSPESLFSIVEASILMNLWYLVIQFAEGLTQKKAL